MSEGVTITFELPVGYEDAQGILHKQVVMRRLKNSDIIAIQADLGFKGLAGKDIDIFSPNPARQFEAAAAMAQILAILYPRVVLSIGTIENPSREVFEGLFRIDSDALRREYATLNEINSPAGKEGADRPFVPGAIL